MFSRNINSFANKNSFFSPSTTQLFTTVNRIAIPSQRFVFQRNVTTPSRGLNDSLTTRMMVHTATSSLSNEMINFAKDCTLPHGEHGNLYGPFIAKLSDASGKKAFENKCLTQEPGKEEGAIQAYYPKITSGNTNDVNCLLDILERTDHRCTHIIFFTKYLPKGVSCHQQPGLVASWRTDDLQNEQLDIIPVFFKDNQELKIADTILAQKIQSELSTAISHYPPEKKEVYQRSIAYIFEENSAPKISF